MSNLIRCQNGHLFSARRYGTVCPYCNLETETQEKKETGLTEEQMEAALALQEKRPVCGWFVCVDGPRKGKDYKVVEGKNFIGRADDMEIQVLGDNEIARRNHCAIAYDAKDKQSYLLPGNSNGMVYLNGSVVFMPTPIVAYNVIELGNSKFIYLPLCGEHFEWK